MFLGVFISLFASTLGAEGEAACYAARDTITAGQPVLAANVMAVDCRADTARAPLHYDRAYGELRASQTLSAGHYLGPIALLSQDAVTAGDALVMRVNRGAVQIERRVTALQTADAGGRVFVRDADGQVFAVPLGELEREAAQ